MTIKDVRLQETRTTVSLVATCKIRRVGTDTVRFTFSKKLKPMIAADASPFAAALLLPSMRQGEDLIIEGSVSQKLLDGMHRIMDTAYLNTLCTTTICTPAERPINSWSPVPADAYFRATQSGPSSVATALCRSS